MAAGANSPGTLKSFFQFIFRIWNLDFAAGDYSPGTVQLITLPAFALQIDPDLCTGPCRFTSIGPLREGATALPLGEKR